MSRFSTKVANQADGEYLIASVVIQKFPKFFCGCF